MKDPVTIDRLKYENEQARLFEIADQREKEADGINWTLRGEERLRNLLVEDKADLVRDMSDTTLAALFDKMMSIMCWNVDRVSFMRPVAESMAIENAMTALRNDQANLAREEFLETGKYE